MADVALRPTFPAEELERQRKQRLTALAQDKYQFTACQFFARLFLTAEYALAVIVIGEEFPARLRGRAIAILTSLATLGVVVIAARSASAVT